MIKIYHNPRCRKSREGLAIIEESGKPFEIIKYLEDNLTRTELEEILKILDINASELVRKQEAIWKSNFKGKDLTEKMIVNALLDHPKLIERPVVIYEGKGVIGRPPENISELLAE
ncbi:arsenate reductase (glutaredoxin) [Muriicola sp. SD30]|uniref:arsenate reductase (glutaredoxin) n=1 Tax=Muriicola sp. SD30 TaxID=3240936 RepID=UPI003510C1C5